MSAVVAVLRVAVGLASLAIGGGAIAAWLGFRDFRASLAAEPTVLGLILFSVMVLAGAMLVQAALS